MHAADLRHSRPSLQQKLEALYTLSPQKKVALGFRPEYLALLEAFDNPHKKLPPTIHIAGTNGKGSSVAMLRAVLEAGGYKVHAYTSPHLIDFNERIYLAGKNIDDDALEKLVDRALALNKGRETTFFEITTAMSFAAFAETPADIFLCEVGLGGRLDCTNIIERPILTILTTISYDHEKFLGDTLQQIAFEKAGIMKPGSPCVVGVQEHPEALETVLQIAQNQAIPVVKATPAPDSTALNLPGAHQRLNAGGVLAALDLIKDRFPVTPEKVQHGLNHVSWPARLQHIEYKYKNNLHEVWYDGGHNESAAKILAVQLQQWRKEDAKPLYLVMAMKTDKNADAFAGHLAPYAQKIVLCEIPGMDSVQVLEGIDYDKATSLEGAFEAIRDLPPGRILVCGSLYLARPLAKALA